jgi:hypothetical protein
MMGASMRKSKPWLLLLCVLVTVAALMVVPACGPATLENMVAEEEISAAEEDVQYALEAAGFKGHAELSVEKNTVFATVQLSDDVDKPMTRGIVTYLQGDSCADAMRELIQGFEDEYHLDDVQVQYDVRDAFGSVIAKGTFAREGRVAFEGSVPDITLEDVVTDDDLKKASDELHDRFSANDYVSKTDVEVRGNTLTYTCKLATSPKSDLDLEATKTAARKNAERLESQNVKTIENLEKIDGIDDVKMEYRYLDASGATLFAFTYTRDGLKE